MGDESARLRLVPACDDAALLPIRDSRRVRQVPPRAVEARASVGHLRAHRNALHARAGASIDFREVRFAMEKNNSRLNRGVADVFNFSRRGATRE